jgi:DNA-directed RNA polymerase subunit N (RpoN/RPB10)
MIGESTLNEYKSYKSIVKHKKRVNRVFSELGAETALRSRPLGVDKKISAVVVAVCSDAPPKARRRRASKKV